MIESVALLAVAVVVGFFIWGAYVINKGSYDSPYEGADEGPYCGNCGARKVKTALPTKYNTKTGKPIERYQLTCPNSNFSGKDCKTPPPPPPPDKG